MLRGSSKNLHNQSPLIQSQKNSVSLSGSLPKNCHGFDLLPGSSSYESSSSTGEQLDASAELLLSKSRSEGLRDSGDFMDFDDVTTDAFRPRSRCQDERETTDIVTSAERLGLTTNSYCNQKSQVDVHNAADDDDDDALVLVVDDDDDTCLKSNVNTGLFAPADNKISEVSDLNRSRFKRKTLSSQDSRHSTQSLTDSLVSRRSKFTPSDDPAASRARQRSLEVVPNLDPQPHNLPNDNFTKTIATASVRAPSTVPSSTTVRAPKDEDIFKDQGHAEKTFAEHSSPKLSDSTSRPRKPKSISSSKAEDLPFPGFEAKALYFFNQDSWPRKYCLMAVTWPYPFSCCC